MSLLGVCIWITYVCSWQQPIHQVQRIWREGVFSAVNETCPISSSQTWVSRENESCTVCIILLSRCCSTDIELPSILHYRKLAFSLNDFVVNIIALWWILSELRVPYFKGKHDVGRKTCVLMDLHYAQVTFTVGWQGQTILKYWSIVESTTILKSETKVHALALLSFIFQDFNRTLFQLHIKKLTWVFPVLSCHFICTNIKGMCWLFYFYLKREIGGTCWEYLIWQSWRTVRGIKSSLEKGLLSSLPLPWVLHALQRDQYLWEGWGVSNIVFARSKQSRSTMGILFYCFAKESG